MPMSSCRPRQLGRFGHAWHSTCLCRVNIPRICCMSIPSRYQLAPSIWEESGNTGRTTLPSGSTIICLLLIYFFLLQETQEISNIGIKADYDLSKTWSQFKNLYHSAKSPEKSHPHSRKNKNVDGSERSNRHTELKNSGDFGLKLLDVLGPKTHELAPEPKNSRKSHSNKKSVRNSENNPSKKLSPYLAKNYLKLGQGGGNDDNAHVQESPENYDIQIEKLESMYRTLTEKMTAYLSSREKPGKRGRDISNSGSAEYKNKMDKAFHSILDGAAEFLKTLILDLAKDNANGELLSHDYPSAITLEEESENPSKITILQGPLSKLKTIPDVDERILEYGDSDDNFTIPPKNTGAPKDFDNLVKFSRSFEEDGVQKKMNNSKLHEGVGIISGPVFKTGRLGTLRKYLVKETTEEEAHLETFPYQQIGEVVLSTEMGEERSEAIYSAVVQNKRSTRVFDSYPRKQSKGTRKFKVHNYCHHATLSGWNQKCLKDKDDFSRRVDQRLCCILEVIRKALKCEMKDTSEDDDETAADEYTTYVPTDGDVDDDLTDTETPVTAVVEAPSTTANKTLATTRAQKTAATTSVRNRANKTLVTSSRKPTTKTEATTKSSQKTAVSTRAHKTSVTTSAKGTVATSTQKTVTKTSSQKTVATSEEEKFDETTEQETQETTSEEDKVERTVREKTTNTEDEDQSKTVTKAQDSEDLSSSETASTSTRLPEIQGSDFTDETNTQDNLTSSTEEETSASDDGASSEVTGNDASEENCTLTLKPFSLFYAECDEVSFKTYNSVAKTTCANLKPWGVYGKCPSLAKGANTDKLNTITIEEEETEETAKSEVTTNRPSKASTTTSTVPATTTTTETTTSTETTTATTTTKLRHTTMVYRIKLPKKFRIVDATVDKNRSALPSTRRFHGKRKNYQPVTITLHLNIEDEDMELTSLEPSLSSTPYTPQDEDIFAFERNKQSEIREILKKSRKNVNKKTHKKTKHKTSVITKTEGRKIRKLRPSRKNFVRISVQSKGAKDIEHRANVEEHVENEHITHGYEEILQELMK